MNTKYAWSVPASTEQLTKLECVSHPTEETNERHDMTPVCESDDINTYLLPNTESNLVENSFLN